MTETKNTTWKYDFILFVLLCDYFYSVNLYKNGELPRNQIGGRGVRVKKEIWDAQGPHKTLNLVISRCCLAEDDKCTQI